MSASAGPTTTDADDVQLQPDTIPFVQKLQLGPGIYGTLDERRSALRADIRGVDCISPDDFLRNVLPQSYIAKFPNLDLVIKQLKKASGLADDGSWANFPLKSSAMKETEVVLYGRLVGVVTAISKAATAIATDSDEADRIPPHLEYLNNGNMTPESKHRVNTSRPDGFFALKTRPKVASAPKRIRWCDIAVVAEFKKAKKDDAIRDNVDKILWGMNHLMSEDICRDFVYGFTIEDTSMKMWYCDRSNIVVSDEFDIHEDNLIFLKFCLAILYASKAELGWDMTIEPIEPAPSEDAEKEEQELPQRVKEAVQAPERSQEVEKASADPANPEEPDVLANPARYIINVRIDEQVTRRFITTTPISLRGADGIRGRGTRVWKAHEIVDGKEDDQEVAVKDYWIDADREREGDIVKSIIAAAPSEPCRTLLKNHIVNVLCHGDVYREHVSVIQPNGRQPVAVKKMVPDSTRNLKGAIERRNSAINLYHPKAAPASAPSQKDQLVAGEHTPVTPSAYFMPALGARRPLPGAKIRNRLVMKQIGEPLHAENSLCSVFNGLVDVSNALQAIHESGWMHRDISTGNIILHNNKGILIDFEYAKRIPKAGKTPSHGGRTGTPYFMAVEVQISSYLFIPPKIKPRFSIYDRKHTHGLPPPGLPLNPLPTASPKETEPKLPENSRKRGRGRKSEGPDGAQPQDSPDHASEDAHDGIPQAADDSYPFVYNPMHDFEALVWIGNYFIFNRMVDGAEQQQPQELDAQISFARLLFSGNFEHRWKLLNSFYLERTATFDHAVRQLHPEIRGIGNLMKEWIHAMVTLYRELEARDPTAIVSSEAALELNSCLLPYPTAILAVLSKKDIKVKFLPMQTSGPRPPAPGNTSEKQEQSTRPAQRKPRLK